VGLFQVSEKLRVQSRILTGTAEPLSRDSRHRWYGGLELFLEIES
jgi:hypothetical protein